MKKLFSSVLIAVGCLCSCSQAPKDFQIQFDNTKEVSGQGSIVGMYYCGHCLRS